MFMVMIFAYCMLAATKKDPSFLGVFLVAECMILFPHPKIMEYEAYLVVFILWSYIASSLYNDFKENKSKKISIIACIVICLLSILMARDVYFYGEFGVNGEAETFLYSYLEYISFSAHAFFVCSFINVSKIRNGLRSAFSVFSSIKSNSYYFNII